MKSTKLIITIIILGAFAVLGYVYFESIQHLEVQQEYFHSAPDIADEFTDIDDISNIDLLFESDLDELEALSFDDIEFEVDVASGEAFETELETTEQEEADIESSLEELEALDF